MLGDFREIWLKLAISKMDEVVKDIERSRNVIRTPKKGDFKARMTETFKKCEIADCGTDISNEKFNIINESLLQQRNSTSQNVYIIVQCLSNSLDEAKEEYSNFLNERQMSENREGDFQKDASGAEVSQEDLLFTWKKKAEFLYETRHGGNPSVAIYTSLAMNTNFAISAQAEINKPEAILDALNGAANQTDPEEVNEPETILAQCYLETVPAAFKGLL